MTTNPDTTDAPKCRHPGGGAVRCSYCGAMTCPTCHHGRRHLTGCPQTKKRETRGGTT